MYNKILIGVLILVSIILLVYQPIDKEGLKNKIPKDYLDGIDVIYWINLDRSTDRRQRMETMFKDPVFKGKKIIRVQAVDGKAANIDEILNANFEGMQPNRFTKVEYACTLSHLNAIRQFSQSDDKVALIMEDDMTLEYKPYWKKSVKQIMDNAPSDWEIISLTYITSKLPTKLYSPHHNMDSTGAYLIKNNKINLPNYIKLESNLLHTADNYIFDKIKTYFYKYPLFIYAYNETSTIHQEHVERYHNKSKQQIDDMLATLKL